MMISCARVRYVVVAVVRRDVSSCACARGLVAVAVARRDVSTARALVRIAFRNMKLVRMRMRGCGDAPKAEQGRLEPG